MNYDDESAGKQETSKTQIAEQQAPVNQEPAKQIDQDGPNGIKYHVVEEEESINSIARRFKISTDDFRKWNAIPNGIQPGIQVVVYKPDKNTSSTHMAVKEHLVQQTVGKQTTTLPAGSTGEVKYHVVEPEETLYHISSVYHITVQQLRDWNKLAGSGVSVGQKLIVGK